MHAVAVPLRGTRIAAAIEFLRLPKVTKYIPANRRALFLEKLVILERRIGRLKTAKRIQEVVELVYEFESTGANQERGWAAWQRTMVRVRQLVNHGKLSKGEVRIPFFNAVVDEYRAGRQVTVRQLRDEMGRAPGRDSFFSDMLLESHHSVPTKDVLWKMVRAKHKDWTNDQVNDFVEQVKDTMPGFPLDPKHHRLATTSFHRILDEEMRGQRTVAEMRSALIRANDRFGLSPEIDDPALFESVKSRVLEWLSSPEAGLP